MKVTRRTLITAAAALALAVSPLAVAKELGGVTMPDTMTAGGKTLKLNGMGLRKKAIFKVYVGGLYVESPSSDGLAIAAADAPKTMRMQFLRDVDKGKIGEGFKEGFEGNAAAKMAALKPQIDKFMAALPDMKDGEVITYSYEPGKGTVVTQGQKEVVVIEGKDFAEALFLIWLGPKPPTEDLKKGLLGK